MRAQPRETEGKKPPIGTADGEEELEAGIVKGRGERWLVFYLVKERSPIRGMDVYRSVVMDGVYAPCVRPLAGRRLDATTYTQHNSVPEKRLH